MPAPFSGSNYTNLQSIINANQNNQLGQTIQGGVQKGLSGLTSGLNQAQQQFQTDVNNANNQQQNQAGNNVVGQAISGIQNAQVSNTQIPAQQTTNVATAPPPTQPPQQASAPAPAPTQPSQPSTTSQAASSNAPAAQNAAASQTANSAPGSFGAYQTPTINVPAGQAAQVGQWSQGNYTGPTQLNNYAGLQAQAQNLQQQGQQVNTPGGLQALLQQYVGGPQYNQGEQKLDTLLLGQTGRPELQNILNSTQNLVNLPQSAQAQAQTQAAMTAAGNQQFAKDIQGQIQAAENPITQAIQQQIQQGQTTSQKNLDLAQQIYNMLSNAAPNTAYAAPGSGALNSLVSVPTPVLDENGNPITDPDTGQPVTSGSTMQTAGQANYNGPGIYAGTMNTLPTVNRIGATVSGPVLSNQTGLQQSSLGQTDAALQAALKGGLLDQKTANNLAGYFASQSLQNGNTPQSALLQALTGYTPGETVSSVYNPSQQQAATAQQAAQMNALQQLAGQTPTYNTYGGANPYAPTFDLSKIAGYNPNATYNAPTSGVYGIIPGSGGGLFDGMMLPSFGQALTPGAGISPGVVPGMTNSTPSFIPRIF